jgi:transposase
VLKRVGHRCQENRVLLVTVPPSGTSRECPNILCRCASALNRRGELFRCVACGHTEDADGVGAGNIRSRTLRNLNGRRRWLNSHPDSPNKAHSVHRRSVASRRRKKVLA